MRFADRNYDTVSAWFEQDFSFLNPSDREDAMHHFFLTLSQRLGRAVPQQRINGFKKDSVAGKLSLYRYLRVAAKNVARDFAKQEMGLRLRETPLRPDTLMVRLSNVTERLLACELELMLQDIKVLGKISDRDWDVFRHSLHHGTTETADNFSLSSGAVHTVNCRVRSKLVVIRNAIIEKYGHVGEAMFSDADYLSLPSDRLDAAPTNT